jgi:hypothetical protein
MSGGIGPMWLFEGPMAVSEEVLSGGIGPVGLFEGPMAVSEDQT